ncbi:hypothetical protein CK218_27520 [Mesorhizobium sp. WSM3879]|nr:hypothetical protein CK218_27520 [Mesorhizobium sp. WSM3879]
MRLPPQTAHFILGRRSRFHRQSISAEAVAERRQIQLLMAMAVEASAGDGHGRVDQFPKCPAIAHAGDIGSGY